MSDNSKKVSQLPTAANAALTDRVVILRDPSGSPSVRTITVANLANALPIANTSVAGTIKVGNNLTINATGFLNAEAGGEEFPTPNISYTGVFGALPTYWMYAQPRVFQYTSNGSYANIASNLYWLHDFDDQDYDLSGLISIKFENIGGINGRFDFSDKSEAALEEIDMGDIAAVATDFYIAGFGSVLQNFYANNLTYVGDYFEIYSNGFQNGPNIDFPLLSHINGNFYLTYNNTGNGLANTIAPSFPALKRTDGFSVYNNSFISYPEFTSLESLNNNLYFYNNDVATEAPGFPALTNMSGWLQIYQNPDITTIPEFTSLEIVGGAIQVYGNPDLTEFPSFPVLTSVGYVIEAYNCTSMTTVGTFLPSILSINGSVNFANCALDEESVDAILIKLASLDGTGGTTSYDNYLIDVSGGTNSIPSAAGLSAKATLEARGCTVNVNT